MTDGAGDQGRDAAAEARELKGLRDANLRSARRIGRLEATLTQLEQIRDTNARLLDRLVTELETERRRSHELLLNILPQPVIDRLNAGERVIADRHDDVAMVFSDFVGFTAIADRLPVATMVADLNSLFSAFDAACAMFGVEKIKTIGDAYLAAAGLSGAPSGGSAGPVIEPPPAVVSASAAADLALAMRDTVAQAGAPWQIRIGLHIGQVIAGVIGTYKYSYDVWGDAVNVASRLETSALPGTIQVSSAVAAILRDTFVLESRGTVELKGKGPTASWLLLARR